MLDALLDGLRFVSRLVMFHDEQFNFMAPFREIATIGDAPIEFQRCDAEQVVRAFLSVPNDAMNSPLHAAVRDGVAEIGAMVVRARWRSARVQRSR